MNKCMTRCLASLVIMQVLIRILHVRPFHTPETGGKWRRDDSKCGRDGAAGAPRPPWGRASQRSHQPQRWRRVSEVGELRSRRRPCRPLGSGGGTQADAHCRHGVQERKIEKPPPECLSGLARVRELCTICTMSCNAVTAAQGPLQASGQRSWGNGPVGGRNHGCCVIHALKGHGGGMSPFV